MVQFIVAFFSGILVSIFGQLLFQCIRDSNKRRSLARAIITELDVVWKFYYEDFGKLMDKAIDQSHTTPLKNIMIVPKMRITQNYFQVYDSNCGQIFLYDSDTAKQIISAYTWGKALIESLKSWTEKREATPDLESLNEQLVTVKYYEENFSTEIKKLRTALEEKYLKDQWLVKFFRSMGETRWWNKVRPF